MNIYEMKLPNYMILWSFLFFNKSCKPLITKPLMWIFNILIIYNILKIQCKF